MNVLRAISLCSGYGGLEMALRLAGWPVELAYVADVDPGAGKVLAHHHPDVRNLGDLTRIAWDQIGAVDLLAAGFPCQDISPAGKQAGMGAGTRSGIWSNIAEGVGVLRPRVVLLENVAALLSTHANRSTDGTDGDVEPGPAGVGGGADRPVLRAIGAVLGDLSDLGYDAVWQVVSAAEVGAPHLRRRVFILAWPAADPPRDMWRFGHGDGLAVAGAGGLSLLPTPNAALVGNRIDTQLSGDGRVRPNKLGWAVSALLPTPNAALGRGTGTPSRATAQDRFDQGKRFLDDAVSLLPTPTARDGDGRGEGSPDYWQRRRDELGRDNGIPLGAAVTLLPTPTVADSRGTRNATAGRTKPPEESTNHGGWTLSDVAYADRWGEYAPAIARWERVVGRPAPEPTETGTKGQPRLAARFVEWMQGLPDGHVTAVPGISRNDALRLLGNGVVPQQGAAAVARLASVVAAVTAQGVAA